MKTALNAIAFKAQTHPKHRFQDLYGQLNGEALYRAWGHLGNGVFYHDAAVNGIATSCFLYNKGIISIHERI
jgi:hypothetical protein